MRISNRRNSILSNRRRRSVANLPLSFRCNKYINLCNRRSQAISTAEGELGQKTSV
jgi:hypothetical protein